MCIYVIYADFLGGGGLCAILIQVKGLVCMGQYHLDVALVLNHH